MADDVAGLVERLRFMAQGGWDYALYGEAADSLTALQAEVERLRAASLWAAEQLREHYGSIPAKEYPGPPTAIIQRLVQTANGDGNG